jgi:DNA topoisomerase-1
MGKNLVIVESPAKAKTIEGYLGKDFIVKSSYGHVRDLPKSDLAIDVQRGFHTIYEISPDKQQVIAELKKLAKQAEHVWLATDEDREGEAISWHLAEALGLDVKTTKRIVFHEITKKAIQKAIETPRTIDVDLVNAQQARRVLDRLVGFELSPVLWKKVKGGLSAGRVQSVAVRIIVERERDIDQFVSSSFYNVRGSFDLGTATLKADLARKLKNHEEANAFLNKANGAEFSITNIETKPAKRTPAAPFTTSTLQQEAGRKLGFSVSRTMSVAQRLYESGKITYMRTDSVNLSDYALDAAKQEIVSSFGEKYSKTRQYTSKAKGAQEAHEAIRPTEMATSQIGGDRDEARLYELIWKRTLASQMADAELEKTTATVGISTMDDVLHAKGEVIKFDGFLKVYIESSDDEDAEDGGSGMLPPLTVGQKLNLIDIVSTQRFTQKPPRYSEASLVKRLEELGIGRPSTYAPTISTIQNREYIEKKDKDGTPREFEVLTLKKGDISSEVKTENTGAEKAKLFPTDIGMVVNDFLVQNFPQILDYQFTASVEQEFDEIAEGKLQWQEMMKKFYHPFHENVTSTIETAERATGERELGKDPTSGKPVIARIGRFGPMVQIGESDDEDKRFASLTGDMSIGNVTLEQALKLFELPRQLGSYEGKDVLVNVGRFGPYVKWGEEFISLPKGAEVMDVDFEQAVAVIAAKQQADAPVGTYQGKPITKGKGRFGPFIKWNDMFINIPRAYNYDTITQAEMDELIGKKVEKESNRFIQNWETEKISIENGRWGPFIRFGKKMLKLGKRADGEKFTVEDLAVIDLDDVKKMIEAQDPTAFTKKAPAKKSAAKKASAKKAAAKKSNKK